MLEAILSLHREGGLALVVVIVLAAACVLLYRDTRQARAALLEVERKHARDMVEIALKLGTARLQRFGATDPPPPALTDQREDHSALERKRAHAWRLIERHLQQISGDKP